MDLLVRGKYVMADPVAKEKGLLTDAAVSVQGNTIVEVGDYRDLRDRYPQLPVLGDGRQLLLPGLIDSHSHGSGISYFQKGIPYDFLENLLLDWAYAIRIDPALDAKLCAVRHLQNGCTTIHHNDWGKPLDPEAEERAQRKIAGYGEAGIRLTYSPGIRNTNILAYDDVNFYQTLPQELQEVVKPLVFFDKEAAVDEYFALFDKLYSHYNGSDRKIILGPSWVQGATEDFLIQMKEKSAQLNGTPLHIHVLQTPLQKALGLKKYGKSLLFYLDDFGLVNENLVCGHCVFATEEDIQLLAHKKASITHHPSCNLAVRNGITPVLPMYEKGVNIALGIDNKGINDDEDPIMELRMIYYLHRISTFDLQHPPFTGFDVLEMATTNGASVCGFAGDIGALKQGMKADMILVDLHRILHDPWVSPELSIIEAFIGRGRGDDVNTVIVNGEVVMEERRFLTIDVDDLYAAVREEVKKGLSPAQREYAQQLAKIKPYYHDWYAHWTDYVTHPFYVVNSRV